MILKRRWNMKIKFYRYTGEKNKINKIISNPKIVEANIDVSSEIMNPIIRYDVSDTTDYILPEYNYLMINIDSTTSDFANRPRYYFISDIKSIASGVFLLYTKLDVLMTYRDEILNSTADIERSSSNYNLYLNDDFYQAYAYPRIGCKQFPSGFSNNYNYLLTVCNTL